MRRALSALFLRPADEWVIAGTIALGLWPFAFVDPFIDAYSLLLPEVGGGLSWGGFYYYGFAAVISILPAVVLFLIGIFSNRKLIRSMYRAVPIALLMAPLLSLAMVEYAIEDHWFCGPDECHGTY